MAAEKETEAELRKRRFNRFKSDEDEEGRRRRREVRRNMGKGDVNRTFALFQVEGKKEISRRRRTDGGKEG